MASRPNHSASASASVCLASASSSALASCPAGLVNITGSNTGLIRVYFKLERRVASGTTGAGSAELNMFRLTFDDH